MLTQRQTLLATIFCFLAYCAGSAQGAPSGAKGGTGAGGTGIVGSGTVMDNWAASNFKSNGTTFFVRAGGKDEADGKSPASAWKTIAKAATVAGAGDTVYIGAGTYQHTTTINFSNNASADSPCRYIADKTGKITGDGGDVNIMAPRTGQVWTLYFNNVSGYALIGINLVEDPLSQVLLYDSTAAKWNYKTDGSDGGIWEHGIAAVNGSFFLLKDCKLSGFHYGFHANTFNNVFLSGCRFENPRYMSTYPYFSNNFLIENCTYDATRVVPTYDYHYIHAYSYQSTTTYRNCSFDHSNQPKAITSDYMIYDGSPADKSAVGTLDVQNCDFKNGQYLAIYTAWGKKANIQNNTITDCRYGIHGMADSVSVDYNTVIMNPTNKWWKDWSWGIYVAKNGDRVDYPGVGGRPGTAQVTNAIIKGFSYNLYIGTSNPTLANITVEGRGTDYYLADFTANPNWTGSYGVVAAGSIVSINGADVNVGCSELALNVKQELTITNCYQGIYGSQANLTIDDMTLAGHMHGVNLSYGSLTMRNCIVSDSLWHGISSWYTRSLTLQNCQFLRNGINQKDNSWGWGWGVYSYAFEDPTESYSDAKPGTAPITMTNCEFTGNGHGVQLSGYSPKYTSLSSNTITGRLDTSNPSNWKGLGYGAYLLYGDYNLANDQEFVATSNYIGIVSSNTNSFVMTGYHVRGNAYGVQPTWTKTASISQCAFEGNQGAGLYTYRCDDASISDCTFQKNGTGYYDAWSSIAFQNSVAQNNTSNGFGADNSRQFVANNISSQNNGANGGAFSAVRNLQLNGCNFTGNKSWNLYTYENYYRKNFEPNKFLDCNSPWGVWSYLKEMPPQDQVSISKSVFNDSQDSGGGGLYVYSYEEGAFFDLRDISVDNNMWYGIYLTNGNHLDGRDRNLTVTNNWYGIVFNNQTIELNGMQGMDLRDNLYALCVWYKDGLTMRKCELQRNGFGVYCYQGNLDIQDCNFDECGIFSYYLDLLTVRRTSIRNANMDRLYRDNKAWRWQNYGLYSWTDKPRKGWEIEDVTVSGSRHGIILDGYSAGDIVLNNVNCVENSVDGSNSSYGCQVSHMNVVANNCKFSGNSYLGFYADGRIYDGKNWVSSGQRTTLNNCDISNNGGYGALSYFADMEFNGCSANNNTYSGLYLLDYLGETRATIRNCTANGNKSHGILCNYMPLDISDSTASENGGMGIHVALADANITNCTANNNTSVGLYVYGPSYYDDADKNQWYPHPSRYVRGVTQSYDRTQVHQFNIANCDTSNGQHSGIYAYNGETSIANCSANNNAIYGIYTAYGRADGSLSCVVNNTTTNGNGSIGFYHYGSSANITGLTCNDNKGVGSYFYGSWWTKQPYTVNISNSTFNGSRGHGLQSAYETMNLQNVTVSNNGFNADGTVNWGGGYTNGAPFTAKDCDFSNNTAYGLEAWYGADVNLERCTMNKNRNNGLMLYDTHSGLVKNCVVTDNGYGVRSRDNGIGTEIWNTTIANNVNYNRSQAGFYHEKGTGTLHNCIVTNNNYGLYNASAAASILHSYNLVSGNAGGDFIGSGVAKAEGELVKPPRFVDPTAGNYQLAKGSPAINSGMNVPGVVDADMLGRARPLFKVTEMGAFEYTNAAGSVRVVTWEEKK